jgi:muramoyltetrapeptide carboxypeptidase
VIVKPPRLRQGDAIGVIAPAGPVTPAEVQPGIELLRSLGFEVVPAAHLYDRQEYLAGEDALRLQDLHEMLRNEDVRAIFCARGGYGTLRLLQRIDFKLFRRWPKILAGYSDITALHLAVHKKTGLVTFHGPMVKDLTKNGNQNLHSLLDLVGSDQPVSLNLSEGSVLKPGKAVGRLLGGNLSLVSHLAGTPFMPDLKGAILFIEEKGEALYRVDRMLTHLRLSGLLKGLSGLLAGEFEDCGEISSVNDLLMDVLSDVDIPVVSGIPFGHGEVNISLPIGLQAVLDTETLTLSLPESCVSNV